MELSVLSQIIIGLIQGVTEWLPISSTAFISLYLANFFNIVNLSNLVEIALFFHLGTFFSALIYFRKDILNLTKNLFHYKEADEEKKSTINFLITATIISSIIGVILIKLILNFSDVFGMTGRGINVLIGIFLVGTGFIQLKPKSNGKRLTPNFADSIILGVAQGISILPGISRSGITISTLLLRKIESTKAIKLSFLLSLPIVLFGNIILNLSEFRGGAVPFVGILSSFIFGILTIHLLLKLSRKINFGWFCILFGILMGISVLF